MEEDIRPSPPVVAGVDIQYPGPTNQTSELKD